MVAAKNWKRDKRQESGAVLRWFDRGDDVISVVEGNFPGEVEVRTTIKGESFVIRGSTGILKETDEKLIERVERAARNRG